ncbi:diguanylate cyclase [Paenibacillus chartarius]|uniref:Diguanylate cyclase n=1 Tax=Paenibacillus chartarius TaxID=747481 RepID=A0ABV6DMQ7_9BACL
MHTDSNNRLMREVQRLFVNELESQLKRLELLELRLSEEPASFDESALALYRIVHTLKGSAAMFGFARIGKVAERLTQLWEWTQEPEGEGCRTEHSKRRLYRHSLAGTSGLISDLRREFDISKVEYEMDKQKVKARQLSGGAHKGRLLVIDDDDTLRSYLVSRLNADGYEVSEAADVDTAIRLLREQAFDLITLDLVMHPKSGYELFELLKEDPTLQWIPTIVLSGREDVSDKVRCFYMGSDDYVTKPFQYEELAARIYRLLKRTESFEQLAFRDPLTGVYNRLYFDNQIKLELQRAERYPAPLSIAFLDIDKFKSINDTYGHHIGDLVLQGLSHIVQQRLRATDLLARFGGEEYVIAMPNTDGEQAKQVVQHILQQVRDNPAAQNDGNEYRITFSAGIAEWKPGQSVKDWLQAADQAMYEAKQEGRNRVLLAREAGIGSEEQIDPWAGTSSSEAVRRNVLVADDDMILRSIVIGRLRELEMPLNIVETGNGDEAYELLVSRPFDLCILDGSMPGMDGLQVLERLHRRHLAGGTTDHEQTKVMMLSGRKKDDDIARGYELGAHDYLPKPFSLVELDLRVKRLLDL